MTGTTLQDAAETPERRLVLIGAGHAHVEVLDAFRRHPAPGIRILVVNSGRTTPYSGKLPGFVAGLHGRDAIDIDVAALCAACGADFRQDTAISIDSAAKVVVLQAGPPVSYDVASIDIGIAPDMSGIEGARDHAIPVKPISAFASRWRTFLDGIDPGRPPAIAIVGGGVAGAELSMAIVAALTAKGSHSPGSAPDVTLIAGDELAPGLNERARAKLMQALQMRGVRVRRQTASRITASRVELADGETIASDATFVTTGAAPPDLIARSGLPTDDTGFLALEPTLQVVGLPDLFGAGDCTTMLSAPRPKAGVFAVRQGPPLAENLRRTLQGRPCLPYRPQRDYLMLIGTGDGGAIGARGNWLAIEGRWVWWLKRVIDERWIKRFRV